MTTKLTRADKYTQTQKKQEYFSDFLNNFDKHPITSTLARITNEDSITQSIRNIVLTNLGERVFEPNIGSDIKRALFEPNDTITAENIILFVKSTIKQNEPRALVNNVFVYPSPDDNSFTVNVVYSVINNPVTTSLNLILRRVR
jgi:phage baseplate assembly protein W